MSKPGELILPYITKQVKNEGIFVNQSEYVNDISRI